MGFFDWVMTGLGFEAKDKKINKKDKLKNSGNNQQDKYANFNLHERIDQPSENVVSNFDQPSQNGLFNYGVQTESNIIMVEPRSHKEIQQVVDYLKQGQSVAVNLEGISSVDSERILDFLSGAVYGLNASIHRWYGDLFLLAPEGHKILKQEKTR